MILSIKYTNKIPRILAHLTLYTLGIFCTAQMVQAQSLIPGIAVDKATKQDSATTDQITEKELMNVAYGRQTKQAVTGAISTIGGDAMAKTLTPTLSNTLFGRLPGLTVMSGSGEPGFDEPSMLIRGLGTFNHAGFLVIVDGFEASFDNLSVEEIESVSVLKDAAALALYGTRGANGVLLVTTKRGFDGKTQIRFTARTGFQKPTRLPDFVNSYDYGVLYNEALANDGLPVRYSPSDLENYRSGNDPFLFPDVNWYNEVLGDNAPISDINLTFSGGGETTRYFILLGYMQNQGLYANTDPKRKENSNADFRRVNFRSNIDVAISSKVTASLDFGGRIENRFFPNVNGFGLWENMARYPSNAFPVTNPDGSWGGTSRYPNNPVASVLGRGYTSSHDRNIMTNLRLSEDLGDLIPGLRFSQAIGINNWHRGNYNRTRSLAFYEIGAGDSGSEEPYLYYPRGLDTGFSVQEWGNDQWNRVNIQAALDYEKQLGHHGLTGMLMYHQDVLSVSGNNVPYANQSLMGRFTYNYQSRFFAELGFAYSGSERFPEGHRFGFFPSLSGAWIVSNEEFLKGSSVVNFLKARASAGILGNDRFGGSRFAYTQDFYYSGEYRLGLDNVSNGIINYGQLGNSEISWEKDLKFNVGFEATLYNKLAVVMDLFYNRRSNMPVNTGNIFPGYIGVLPPYENIGKVNNRGFELDLRYTDHIGSFNYFVGASGFFAKNKIIEMGEIAHPESYMYRTGHAIGQHFGWEADGFYSPDDFEANGELKQGVLVSSFAAVKPGDIKYIDQNGDGRIDQNDEIAIGKTWLPEFIYTFNVGAQYKGFDLELLFYGLTNRSINLNGTYFWGLQNDANLSSNALNRWTPENQENATFPRLTTLANENNYRPSTFWMKSGNLLRLRNIELGYAIPEVWAHQIKVDNLRVFVNAVNLLTWDKMDMVDPEAYGGYPPLKSLNLGISVQF
ncbi:TonB-linked SusC/RagA family outer membrane protein [Algoriphagus sp. 4150]|uniref:SusC/RagA family TonB-linked outer membrane protein n=1 Tax=Algoriphagus sp. 4150 TaxID=2817756 RepID=UPI002863D4FF|nr:TonB-dependent receptor [Algoriphagus sp. 4150]MDR7129543.1 TonB-linked SusC/RagA family outer membrane protein [Algoriphagus sp. 4150]